MGRSLGFAHSVRCRAARLVATLAVLWLGLVAIPPAQAADAVLVGAGDIADCAVSADAATAALVGSIGGRVFTLLSVLCGDKMVATSSCNGFVWSSAHRASG